MFIIIKKILLKPDTNFFTLNDPIYGFISLATPIVYELIEHPYFQRLRRISQMGLSYLVFPGAHHNRFQHALGALHLMQKAVHSLRSKEVEITPEEEEALYIAILLHDIGHGPFSHAMENSIVEEVNHETISLLFMNRLNQIFDQKLTKAIAIFKGQYSKKFLCALVSGQLDMDRLDYLKRDSFYAGTPEGNINSERLIAMLNVVNNTLVIEEKGIYSLEKFLLARRFMYWQVYLHKTSMGAEMLLGNILKRAKELSQKGQSLPAHPDLQFFLKNSINRNQFSEEVLDIYAGLDDSVLMSAVNQWQHHADFVLSDLCRRLLHRKLLKIKVITEVFPQKLYEKKIQEIQQQYNISEEEAGYFVFNGSIFNKAYDREIEQINVLTTKGKVQDIAQVSGLFTSRYLTEKWTKNYLCFPKS